MRDEWSVYLARVKSEAEKVQIDLYTKMVTFTGNGREDSYPILSTESRTSQ